MRVVHFVTSCKKSDFRNLTFDSFPLWRIRNDYRVYAEYTPALCVFVDKATNPLNKETDWDNIKSFCEQLNNEPDGWDAYLTKNT